MTESARPRPVHLLKPRADPDTAEDPRRAAPTMPARILQCCLGRQSARAERAGPQEWESDQRCNTHTQACLKAWLWTRAVSEAASISMPTMDSGGIWP